MRKIQTKEQQKRKERFNQIIIGLILVSLMVMSTLGYSLMSKSTEQKSQKKIIYNGLEFIGTSGFWTLSINQFKFSFKYNPKEVNKSDFNLSYLDKYYSKPLYIKSEDSDSTNEIYRNLNEIVLRMQPACLNKSDCSGDYPIKNCSNNFIIIQESNISDIKQTKNCVFIQGKKQDLVKQTDEFLFKIIGVEG